MLKQIEILNYCNVVCFADANAEIKSVGKYKCILPEEIPEQKFDYILLAKRQASAVKAIKKMLTESLGIEEEKIVLLEDKYCIDGYEEKKPLRQMLIGNFIIRRQKEAQRRSMKCF